MKYDVLPLNVAIWKYHQALLEWSAHSNNAVPVLHILLARDDLAAALEQRPAIHPRVFQYIADLDQQLRDAAFQIVTVIGAEKMTSWRQTRQSLTAAWWWHLDQLVESSREPPKAPSVALSIATAACLIIALVFLLDFAIDFLRTGVDLFALLQVVLPLLLVSTFTQAGRQWTTSLLTWWRVPRDWQPYGRFALAVACLILGLLTYPVFRPWIAWRYNNYGVEQQLSAEEPRLSVAINAYQRAISLDPDYAEAYYNLATAYEDLRNYDQAIAAYQQAIEYNDQAIFIYNNLARLYVLSRADYAAALELLNQAETLLPASATMTRPEQQTAYAFYKNRGWAYTGLQLYALAEADLRYALTLEGDTFGGGAHCLLAQVLDAQHRDARLEWQRCLARQYDLDVEDSWEAIARERLQ